MSWDLLLTELTMWKLLLLAWCCLAALALAYLCLLGMAFAAWACGWLDRDKWQRRWHEFSGMWEVR